MTDGNADGEGARRKRQFQKACRELGIADAQWWGYPDIFEKRLPVEDMTERLRHLPTPYRVFTHGIIGEYHHPHHQDVSIAVHRAFADHPRVFASAYNAYPDFTVNLSKEEFENKARVLTKIYGSETSRFLNLLPATTSEGYLKLDLSEVEAVYDFFARGKELSTKKLKSYAWLVEFLKTRRNQKRPF